MVHLNKLFIVWRTRSSLSLQCAGKQAMINLSPGAERCHSAVQKICLISFMVNLRRSKGQARARSLLIWSTQRRQSMWPHGRNISTSFPFSVQLPQVIFGFHCWYFMVAMSISKTESSLLAAAADFLEFFAFKSANSFLTCETSEVRWLSESACSVNL